MERSARGDSNAGAVPTRRVIVVGASNVVRGLSTIIETAELVWGCPLDVLAACGHGRSYGRTSCVFGRSLPGILECGLWDELSQRPALPTAALVTDIGNDILYGAGVDQIAAWVEQCVLRLRAVCDRIVITELPVARVASVTARKYNVLRAILFPASRVTWDDAWQRVRELNERVAELASQQRGVLCVPRLAWYGWDPIHVRRGAWSEAWGEILSGWSDGAVTPRARGSWQRWWQLHRQRPLVRRRFGVEQRRAQPTCTLRSGSVISLY